MRSYLRAFTIKFEEDEYLERERKGDTFLMNAFIYGKILINYSSLTAPSFGSLRLFHQDERKHKVLTLWPMFYYHRWIHLMSKYRFLSYSISSEREKKCLKIVSLKKPLIQFLWLNLLPELIELKLNFNKSEWWVLIFDFAHFNICWWKGKTLIFNKVPFCWLFVSLTFSIDDIGMRKFCNTCS